MEECAWDDDDDTIDTTIRRNVVEAVGANLQVVAARADRADFFFETEMKGERIQKSHCHRAPIWIRRAKNLRKYFSHLISSRAFVGRSGH